MSDEATMAGDATPDDERRARGYLKSTVKHGGIYAIGMVLSRLVGFLMLPVYTRVLTTADYGIMEILSLSTDILSMLVGLGIRQAVLRYYYHYDTEAERNGVISTASLLLVAIFGVTGALGIAFAGPITELLLGPDLPDHFVKLAVLAFACGALGDIPNVYLQARQRSTVVVGASLSRLVIALSLNILFVVYLRMGVAGVFLSTIIASCLVGGVLFVRMLRETGIHYVGTRAGELILFGAPLMVWQIGSFVLHFSDRYFLRFSRSLEDVGIYALSYKLAMLLGTFVIGPFRDIWTAKSLEIARREGERATPILGSIMRQYNLVLVCVAFLIALFATDVVHLMLGERFHAADRAVPVLAIAMVFFGYRQIAQAGAMIGGRPGYIAWSTTVAAAAAIALNLALIPRYGAMGAAAATAAAFGIEFIIMRTLALRAHPSTVPLLELAHPILLGTAAWLLAYALVPSEAGRATAIAIRAAVALTFAGALVVTGGLTAGERRAIGRIARDPRSMLRSLKDA
jgi:O-antigen/teichoic acid export membrane protein